MTTGALQQATNEYESLKKAFYSPKPDLAKSGQHLTKLKILLTELSFLVPGDQEASTQELALARDVLEIGALWSVRSDDIPAFERYIAQLKTYYNDYHSKLPPSERLYTLLGLNLLRLLAQNKISDFHTELELIDPEQLGNIYIQHPIQIEQWLMEGSYNKVWNARANVPAEEYAFFMDILMGTIRNEIASCSEKAYESLPLADAATLLHFKSQEEFRQFAEERGWAVDWQGGKVHFGVAEAGAADIPAAKMIHQVLGYARELERIV
ncbi:hypothetical protein HK097_006403 [Rhizophlyctis rosea]|uniref:PCI domain-containing protein n=1 Tax=Rhizophlyctis rosea TaxID=64517 RepID=A0AAD5SL16_9FUNG|nr:hypothetical protein HK097_006403 [Rhizophlyctis rosea]